MPRLMILGKKYLGCMACMKLYYENGMNEQYNCSFKDLEQEN